MRSHTPRERLAQFERKQIIISLLGLIILVTLSILINSLTMTSVAEQSTKFISRMIQIGDFREVGITLQEARLDNFRVIHYQSARPGRSFVLPPRVGVVGEESWLERISREHVEFSTADPLATGPSDHIVFEFDRFQLTPYAFIVWLILVLVSIPQTRFVKRRLTEQFERDVVAERAMARSEISREVRHNLRTPLATLARVPSRLPDAAKFESELLTSTIGQIRALISKLDDGDRVSEASVESKLIYDTLKQSLQEILVSFPARIRMEYDLEDSVVSAVVPHVPVEFRSLLSNIVNNSIDAIRDSGRIFIAAKDLGAEVEISVEDSGQGIAPELIDKIFDAGFSLGKANGTGFGLFHATTWVKKWGGRIYARSTPNVGTTITLRLPIEDRSQWYVPRLKLSTSSKIIIMDDQHSGRELWRNRLLEHGLEHQAMIFAEPCELDRLRSELNQSPSEYIFLFDYDLNGKINGLDLLSGLPDSSSKFLVTGHFDEIDVRERCAKDGVFLIPKSQVADLPIVVRQSTTGLSSSQVSQATARNRSDISPTISIFD